jgi:hypothetical protein
MQRQPVLTFETIKDCDDVISQLLCVGRGIQEVQVLAKLRVNGCVF